MCSLDFTNYLIFPYQLVCTPPAVNLCNIWLVSYQLVTSSYTDRWNQAYLPFSVYNPPTQKNTQESDSVCFFFEVRCDSSFYIPLHEGVTEGLHSSDIPTLLCLDTGKIHDVGFDKFNKFYTSMCAFLVFRCTPQLRRTYSRKKTKKLFFIQHLYSLHRQRVRQ